MELYRIELSQSVLLISLMYMDAVETKIPSHDRISVDAILSYVFEVALKHGFV